MACNDAVRDSANQTNKVKSITFGGQEESGRALPLTGTRKPWKTVNASQKNHENYGSLRPAQALTISSIQNVVRLVMTVDFHNVGEM